jgi:anti-sigma regulatory factor (Ser/Thr protein kinase)
MADNHNSSSGDGSAERWWSVSSGQVTWLAAAVTGVAFLAAVWLLPVPDYPVPVSTPVDMVGWLVVVTVLMCAADRWLRVPLPVLRRSARERVSETTLRPGQFIWVGVLVTFPLVYALVISSVAVAVMVIVDVRRQQRSGELSDTWAVLRGGLAEQVAAVVTFAAVYSLTVGSERGDGVWVAVVVGGVVAASFVSAAIVMAFRASRAREAAADRAVVGNVIQDELLAAGVMALATGSFVVIGVEASLRRPGGAFLLATWVAVWVIGIVGLRLADDKKHDALTSQTLLELDERADVRMTLSHLLAALHACEVVVTYRNETFWLARDEQGERYDVKSASPLELQWMNFVPHTRRPVVLRTAMFPHAFWRAGFVFPITQEGKVCGTLAVGFSLDSTNSRTTSDALARAIASPTPPPAGPYALAHRTAVHVGTLLLPESAQPNANVLLLDALRSMSTVLELAKSQAQHAVDTAGAPPEILKALNTLGKAFMAATTVVSDDEKITELANGEPIVLWDDPRDTTVASLVADLLAARPSEVAGFVEWDTASPAAPLTVIPAGFELALRPVIANAERHGVTVASGPAVISATTDEASDTVQVYVSDNGPGVSPGEEDRIFENGTHGTNGKTEGQGGGLFLARSYAEHLGGTLALVDGGAGATFVLTLPKTSSVGDLFETEPTSS